MNVWYFPLEPLKARYTSQLCEHWIPEAFGANADRSWEWRPVEPPPVSDDIRVGSVLDGVNRGVVSLHQMSTMLRSLHEVRDGDVIYLQDMWTPGLEALYYALDLKDLRVRVYAMCHAQSVDEYDFTYPMRSWMRPIELGWANRFSGLFVASTIHREQLKAAGFTCPIHVVGLPIDETEVVNRMFTCLSEDYRREKQVVFSSRLNAEKNPYFMLDVAAQFLAAHDDWQWVVTTSADGFSSEVPGLLEALYRLADAEPRFMLRDGLTKDGYYKALLRSRIQFNSSLQDYVSWTLLEATLAGCDLCYPDYRSFPECVDASRRYTPFDAGSALRVLDRAITNPQEWKRPVECCGIGRHVEMNIMLNDYRGPEVNVWHQPRSYFLAASLLHD